MRGGGDGGCFFSAWLEKILWVWDNLFGFQVVCAVSNGSVACVFNVFWLEKFIG